MTLRQSISCCRFDRLHWDRYPGCAARPWALESNAVGVFPAATYADGRWRVTASDCAIQSRNTSSVARPAAATMESLLRGAGLGAERYSPSPRPARYGSWSQHVGPRRPTENSRPRSCPASKSRAKDTFLCRWIPCVQECVSSNHRFFGMRLRTGQLLAECYRTEIP